MARENKSSGVRREKKTVKAMIEIYCRGNHGKGKSLCNECQELLDYANRRVDSCPLLAARHFIIKGFRKEIERARQEASAKIKCRYSEALDERIAQRHKVCSAPM